MQRMRSKTLPKTRLHPYKVLAALLYGTYPFVTWAGEVATVQTGPFSRMLHVQASRLKEYFQWLLDYGYLTSLETDHGVALLTVKPPVPRQAGTIAPGSTIAPAPMGQPTPTLKSDALAEPAPKAKALSIALDKSGSVW